MCLGIQFQNGIQSILVRPNHHTKPHAKIIGQPSEHFKFRTWRRKHRNSAADDSSLDTSMNNEHHGSNGFGQRFGFTSIKWLVWYRSNFVVPQNIGPHRKDAVFAVLWWKRLESWGCTVQGSVRETFCYAWFNFLCTCVSIISILDLDKLNV